MPEFTDEFDALGVENLDAPEIGNEDNLTDLPNVMIRSKDLLPVLKVAALISQGSGRDVISRSLYLKAVGSNLSVWITNHDTYINYTIPLVNTDNVYRDSFVIALKDIASLMKVVYQTMIIRKNNEFMEVHVMGGWVPIENVEVEDDRFMTSVNTSNENCTVIPTPIMREVLGSVLNLAINADYVTEKCLLFDDNNVYACNQSSFGSFDIGTSVKQPFAMKVSEAKILNTILGSYIGVLNFNTYEVDGLVRVCISCPTFMMSFINMNSSIDVNSITDSISSSTGETEHAIELRSKFIPMITFIATSGKYSNTFDIVSDGVNLTVNTQMLTCSQSYTFDLLSNVGITKEVKVTLPARILHETLSIFSKYTQVNVSMTPDGICFSTDKLKACCLASVSNR